MSVEASTFRSSLSQWSSIFTVGLAACGVLWGGVGYVDRFASRIEAVDERLSRIERSLETIDARSRIDHDQIIDLQAQMKFLRQQK